MRGKTRESNRRLTLQTCFRMILFICILSYYENEVNCNLKCSVFVQAQELKEEMNTSSGPLRSSQVLRKMKPSSSKKNLNEILIKAGKSGLGGGISGACAGVIQVFSLMWLRTVMNYQYRYGATFEQSMRTLMNEGGVRRFYRGISFALIQAPLSRFVSVAANDGVGTFLESFENTQSLGLSYKTLLASVVVGFFRMALMPIDTCKTVLQVDSTEGFRNLMRRVRVGKIGILYQGMFAQAGSALVSHFPWFYTYNYLIKLDFLTKNKLLRNALIGFIASGISDTTSNFIRVIKTTKQSIASKHTVGYSEVVSIILASDGWKGLFGRGLQTRIFANGIQSVLFTVVWRGLANRWEN